MKITVVERRDDYMAYLQDDKRLWGCGGSPAEAIGSAIMAHGSYISLELDLQLSTPSENTPSRTDQG